MIDERKLLKELRKQSHDYIDPNFGGRTACVEMEDVDYIIEKQPKVGKWISVEKELPKEKGYYLVTRKGHTCAEVRQFRGKKWAVDTQHFGEVIAWQPLPEPYKGE